MKDGLAPATCIRCRRFGGFLCEDCELMIRFPLKQRCMYCGRSAPLGKSCQDCRKQGNLDGLYVLARVEEGPLRELIDHYKHHKIKDIEQVFQELIDRQNIEEILSDPVVSFVPLHSSVLRARGFNQAERLSRMISRQTGWTPGALLQEKSLGQVTCSFELWGRDILLVNDVATTGATLEECARVLKKAGAGRVWGWVITRGIFYG